MISFDKNTILIQLRDGSSHQGTVTSMEPNEGLFVLNSETSKVNKLLSLLFNKPKRGQIRNMLFCRKARLRLFTLLMFLATHVCALNWTNMSLEQLA